MKKILTTTTGEVFGPFNTIETSSDSYLCDNQIKYQINVVGNCVESEVADDYVNPENIKAEINAFNKHQKENRAFAYQLESDPLFFKAQRNEVSLDEWKAKVAEIQERFKYKEQV